MTVTPKKIALTLLPVFWPNLPPLSLASLKGFLTSKGIHADCLDLNNYFFNKVPADLQKEWRVSCNRYLEKNIVEFLKKHLSDELDLVTDKLLEYDAVGMSCYKSNISTCVRVARILKNKRPGIRIIFGGPEIARRYFEIKDGIIRPFDGIADFMIAGEGELPLFHYLTDQGRGARLSAFRELDDLSAMPPPDYSDFDLDRYPKKNSVSLMFSRGCVKRCTFCAEKLLYKKHRVTPVENIVEQIRHHRSNGVTQFIFHDSLINGDLEALGSLADAIIDNFGRIKWEAQIAIRSDMPDRLFEKIKKSGCYHLFVGLESGCDTTLKKMNKGFTSDDAAAFFRKLGSHGLSFGVSIITGFPGESDEDFTESLEFVIKNKDLIPKIEQVNPFVHYNGINLPEEADYKYTGRSLERAEIFIDRIKKEGLKFTRAFMLNLVEPAWKQEP